MITGLILGKFLPLHQGHIALATFGLENCDRLIILLCSTQEETISGTIRMSWLQSTFGQNSRIQMEHIQYDEAQLPNTSVSSPEVSKMWAAYLGRKFPQVNVIFSSEQYGEYVAGYLDIRHLPFDISRSKIPVSGSSIILNPLQNWDFISKAAQPHFVKKILISGTESTGKSTLAETLANHYQTVFVPEMARRLSAERLMSSFTSSRKSQTSRQKVLTNG